MTIVLTLVMTMVFTRLLRYRGLVLTLIHSCFALVNAGYRGLTYRLAKDFAAGEGEHDQDK